MKVPNIFFVNYDLIKKSIIFVDVRGLDVRDVRGRFCGRRLSADLGDGIKRNYLNVAYGIVGFGVDIIEIARDRGIEPIF